MNKQAVMKFHQRQSHKTKSFHSISHVMTSNCSPKILGYVVKLHVHQQLFLVLEEIPFAFAYQTILINRHLQNLWLFEYNHQRYAAHAEEKQKAQQLESIWSWGGTSWSALHSTLRVFCYANREASFEFSFNTTSSRAYFEAHKRASGEKSTLLEFIKHLPISPFLSYSQTSILSVLSSWIYVDLQL